jgi:large subunit ribosomal protein L25
MSEHFTVKAQSRQDVGKGASRRLRHEADLIPAIIYGASKPAQTLSLIHKDIAKLCEHESFFSTIITVEVDGKAEKAILKDMQRHPSKPRILHVDFMRVSAKDKLTMYVPVHFIGEEKSVGVKAGGVVTRHMVEFEIRCLPADLPESIDIDISELPLDHAIHLSDIKLPKGVEFLHPVTDDAHDHPVVSIAEPTMSADLDEASDVVAAEVPSGQKHDAADEANDAEKSAK